MEILNQFLNFLRDHNIDPKIYILIDLDSNLYNKIMNFLLILKGGDLKISNTLKSGYHNQLVKEITLDDAFKKVRSCIQCGTCSASCPSGRYTSFKTRKVIKLALSGIESVLSEPDIWLCSTCFNCYERCPRDIPVTEIILKLRNIAVKEGHLVDQAKGVIRNLLEFGHAVPIGPSDSVWIKLREKLGLERQAPIANNNLEAQAELLKIFEAIKFNQRIHYR